MLKQFLNFRIEAVETQEYADIARMTAKLSHIDAQIREKSNELESTKDELNGCRRIAAKLKKQLTFWHKIKSGSMQVRQLIEAKRRIRGLNEYITELESHIHMLVLRHHIVLRKAHVLYRKMKHMGLIRQSKVKFDSIEFLE